MADRVERAESRLIAITSNLGKPSPLNFWPIVATEVMLLLWIHDSLLLEVVMLLHPIDAFKVWQTAH